MLEQYLEKLNVAKTRIGEVRKFLIPCLRELVDSGFKGTIWLGFPGTHSAYANHYYLVDRQFEEEKYFLGGGLLTEGPKRRIELEDIPFYVYINETIIEVADKVSNHLKEYLGKIPPPKK